MKRVRPFEPGNKSGRERPSGSTNKKVGSDRDCRLYGQTMHRLNRRARLSNFLTSFWCELKIIFVRPKCLNHDEFNASKNEFPASEHGRSSRRWRLVVRRRISHCDFS